MRAAVTETCKQIYEQTTHVTKNQADIQKAIQLVAERFMRVETQLTVNRQQLIA